MRVDWDSTRALLGLMDDPAYAHLELFLYTEADQWPVRPVRRFEPLLRRAGLLGVERRGDSDASPVCWLAVEEYPCANARRGGRFNLGTFFWRRSATAMAIFRALHASQQHGGADTPQWPARQGAFSHDYAVYATFRQHIAFVGSGCPLGSPFALHVAHATGGLIDGVYEPHRAKAMLRELLRPCVADAIRRNDRKAACALYPPWVGGVCTMCADVETFRMLDGSELRAVVRGCCGSIDRSAPTWLLRRALLEPETSAATLEMLRSRTRGSSASADRLEVDLDEVGRAVLLARGLHNYSVATAVAKTDRWGYLLDGLHGPGGGRKCSGRGPCAQEGFDAG
eukprot:2296765-Prymnesium_polylepis.1